jgi:hypothetical protein
MAEDVHGDEQGEYTDKEPVLSQPVHFPSSMFGRRLDGAGTPRVALSV